MNKLVSAMLCATALSSSVQAGCIDGLADPQKSAETIVGLSKLKLTDIVKQAPDDQAESAWCGLYTFVISGSAPSESLVEILKTNSGTSAGWLLLQSFEAMNGLPSILPILVNAQKGDPTVLGRVNSELGAAVRRVDNFVALSANSKDKRVLFARTITLSYASGFIRSMGLKNKAAEFSKKAQDTALMIDKKLFNGMVATESLTTFIDEAKYLLHVQKRSGKVDKAEVKAALRKADEALSHLKKLDRLTYESLSNAGLSDLVLCQKIKLLDSIGLVSDASKLVLTLLEKLQYMAVDNPVRSVVFEAIYEHSIAAGKTEVANRLMNEELALPEIENPVTDLAKMYKQTLEELKNRP